MLHPSGRRWRTILFLGRSGSSVLLGAISAGDNMCTRHGKDSVKIRRVRAVHHTNIYTACRRAIEEPARGYARALVASVIHGSARVRSRISPPFTEPDHRLSIFARIFARASLRADARALFFLSPRICYLSEYFFRPPRLHVRRDARAKAVFLLESRAPFLGDLRRHLRLRGESSLDLVVSFQRAGGLISFEITKKNVDEDQFRIRPSKK